MGTEIQPLTALDERTQSAILGFLAEGNYLKVACEAAGITYRGFRHWQRRVEDGDPEATSRFGDFFAKVNQAVPIGEAVALANLRRGDPGWQAQAWFLERRFPKRWGKQDRPEVSPQVVTKMSDEELETIVEAKGRGRT